MKAAASNVSLRIAALALACGGAMLHAGAAAADLPARALPATAAAAPPDLVVAAARDVLAAWLQSRCDRFEISAGQASLSDSVARRIGSVAARPLDERRPLTSRMQLWVDVAADSGAGAVVPVSFEVHAYRPAWLAARDAHAGEPVENAELARAIVDVAAQRSDPLRELPHGARLRRALFAGDAISASHVESVPAVSRGAPVTVRSSLGAIGVEARGEALQDGRPGTRVWVRLASSTGPIQATVTGEGVVEVDHE